MEQAARDLDLAKRRQANVETRMESMEKWMNEQVTWTEQTVQYLQRLETARVKMAGDIVAANVRRDQAMQSASLI